VQLILGPHPYRPLSLHPTHPDSAANLPPKSLGYAKARAVQNAAGRRLCRLRHRIGTPLQGLAASKLLAPGRSRRLASPNWARNRGVVTHNVGRPAALREPDIYLFSREESPPVTGPMAGFMAGHRSRITTTTLRLLRRAAGWAFRPNILTGSGPAQRPRVWAAV